MHITVATDKFLPILISCFRLDWILRFGEKRSHGVMPEFLKREPRLCLDAVPTITSDNCVAKRGIKRRNAQAAGSGKIHATVSLFILHQKSARTGYRPGANTVAWH